MPDPIVIPLARTGGSSAANLLEKGTYVAKIEAVDVEPSGPSGFPYLKLRLKGTMRGEIFTLWTNVSLSPQARFKLDQLLDAIGAPQEGQISPGDMVSTSVFIAVKVTSYEGTQRNEVDKFLPAANVRPETVLNANQQRRQAPSASAPAAARPAGSASAGSTQRRQGSGTSPTGQRSGSTPQRPPRPVVAEMAEE